MDKKTFAAELRRRGALSLGWLCSQLNKDGSIISAPPDIGLYYKCVYPLAIGGQTALASSMCDTIMRTFKTENGDLHNDGAKKTSGSYTSEYCQIYPMGWIALGARLCGRTDVFDAIIQAVGTLYYNDAVGSVRTKADIPSELYDSNSAAMAIELYSLCDMPKALRAEKFLEKLLKIQPEPGKRFFSRVDQSGNLSYEHGPNPLYSVVDFSEPRQAYWLLGMPAAALTRLYMKTKDESHLRLAIKYFTLASGCSSSALESPGSGKTMWTASMLYRLTHNEAYYNIFKSIAETFISWQRDDGRFLPSWLDESAFSLKFNYDIIPEYTRWFLECSAEIKDL